MGILREIEILGKAIRSWIFFFLSFFIFFFSFGLKPIEVFGKVFTFIHPTFNSFSILFLNKIKTDLLPENIEFIVINPLDALWAQIGIALFLAFVFAFPIFLHNIVKYLSPAFNLKEKKAAAKFLIPGVISFSAGCFFSYFLIIPATFEILYKFVDILEVRPFFAINQFVFSAIVLILSIGIVFTFPVFMVSLSYLGIVDSEEWRKNWKIALFLFLIFSAIITPDGSGITMLILTVPLSALYSLGYIVSKRYSRDY